MTNNDDSNSGITESSNRAKVARGVLQLAGGTPFIRRPIISLTILMTGCAQTPLRTLAQDHTRNVELLSWHFNKVDIEIPNV